MDGWTSGIAWLGFGERKCGPPQLLIVEQRMLLLLPPVELELLALHLHGVVKQPSSSSDINILELANLFKGLYGPNGRQR